MTGKSEQTFSFEIVSCLLVALSENGATVGAKHYKIMAQIDGTKSASGYEHLVRSVKARAKDINEQISSGTIDAATPGGANKTSGGGGKTTTSASGRKSKAETGEDDGETVSPSKKTKVFKDEKKHQDDESEGEGEDDGLL